MFKKIITVALTSFLLLSVTTACTTSSADRSSDKRSNQTAVKKQQSDKKHKINAKVNNWRKLSQHIILIKVGNQKLKVQLYDNPTAHDLIKRLPLKLTMTNYPGYPERVLRLRKPLTMKDAKKGDNPKIPEFGYYKPGNWLAIYYGHIGYFAGKVPLGRIISHTKTSEIGKLPNKSVTAISLLK